ncbi:hypothetical protein SLEP1_g48915 [Rubroshorea leprosula]|uniref:Uncharacterized protein n=1 Tax=Rubroshorea leprosula TaxID=152421 RepID=A0AAV5LW15_9ROSI|nr:hypothetical protein SLEP1_g48915 [Rubroshorea leprosula]
MAWLGRLRVAAASATLQVKPLRQMVRGYIYGSAAAVELDYDDDYDYYEDEQFQLKLENHFFLSAKGNYYKCKLSSEIHRVSCQIVAISYITDLRKKIKNRKEPGSYIEAPNLAETPATSLPSL